MLIKSLLVYFVGSVLSESHIMIQTKLGKLKGASSSFEFNNTIYRYNVFKRIPYAKPPLGSLRFRKPEPYDSWNGILDATEFGPSCIQIRYPEFDKYTPNLNQSEDCLHLNIYTTTYSYKSVKKSVMIWIHGGGFQIGQGMLYDASFLANAGDVIVVTINYRLEALGFFSTGDDVARGNYGLWDQKLAIKWVKNNIESFGGDSNSITIFGQSAGGLSVGLQSLHHGNIGLFRRVIAQSGVANAVFTIKPDPRPEALDLVQLVNCSNRLTSRSVDCLRNKTVQEIHKANMIIISKTKNQPDVHTMNSFAPVVDRDFIVDLPRNILKGNNPAYDFYKSLDVMIGNCDGEGSLLLDTLTGRRDVNVLEGITSDFLCKHIIPTLSADYYKNNTRLSPAICNAYKSIGSIKDQSTKSVEFYGDAFFYSPTVNSLHTHALQNGTASHFQYLNKRYPPDFASPVSWFHGAKHGSELFYLFPSLLSNVTAGDVLFSMTMAKYWSNFAKKGDVNGPGLTVWPQYSNTRKQYALLEVDVTIQHNLYENRMNFLLNDMPKLLQLDETTSFPTTHMQHSKESYVTNLPITPQTTQNSNGSEKSIIAHNCWKILGLILFVLRLISP